jgi:hypothetical protein
MSWEITMNRLLKLSTVFLVLLAGFTGCQLYNAISLAWNIDNVTYNTLTGVTRVSYTVQNVGKVDLTGVNLRIGVDVNNDLTYPTRAWTLDFSINQNQTIHSSIDIYTGFLPLGWATVLNVDMDNPKD